MGWVGSVLCNCQGAWSHKLRFCSLLHTMGRFGSATRIAVMHDTQDHVKSERKLSHRADWLKVGEVTGREHLPNKGDSGFHLALQKEVKSGGQENKSYRRPLLTNMGALHSKPWEHAQK